MQLAGVAVELDLAEQRDLLPGREHVGEIAAVKPFADQDGARGIGEAWLRTGPGCGAGIRRAWRDRTSAITVAISPGASCAIVFTLLRSS